ncbi:hypothetical protein GCM10007242_04650 [Pigmentiphaga litoralis]|uniref:hypothetical protein n=1 Tax=Pigmentiphaga litoralis TaxID=516702 RepID=UPI0016769453|nr:hypothetical protein [Pigmentiphaga litoralis]GGX02646.1 hypothetical protein GCM10007242_04650 [Pigmentiphaga litoralis]
MPLQRMLILSGAIASGKTAVAQVLSTEFGFCRLSTRSYLIEFEGGADILKGRTSLQDLGDRLDHETDFRWVVDCVADPAVDANPQIAGWMLDAARKPQQVQHFRERFGNAVRHVHLRAREDILHARYSLRAESCETSYRNVQDHPNEIAARGLELLADAVFDTSRLNSKAIGFSVSSLWES